MNISQSPAHQRHWSQTDLSRHVECKGSQMTWVRRTASDHMNYHSTTESSRLDGGRDAHGGTTLASAEAA